MCIRDRHGSIPEIQMLNKKPIITLTKKVQLTTSLINQNVVNEAVMETNEHTIVEELWYKIEDTYFTSTKIVPVSYTHLGRKTEE